MRAFTAAALMLSATFTAAPAQAGPIPEKPSSVTTLEVAQPPAQVHKAVREALKKLKYRIDTQEGEAYIEASSGPPIGDAMMAAVHGRSARASEAKLWLEAAERGTRVSISVMVSKTAPGAGGAGTGTLTSSFEDGRVEQESIRDRIEKSIKR
jgi:hypothetical protein